jgi:DNA polymerase-3 subunit alpha
VIAKRCSTMARQRDPILPPFESADGLNEEEELTAQAEAGLQSRLLRHVYDDNMDEAARAVIAKPYFDRLAFELNVIKQMGFPGYFLIVADFIQWAKAQNIPVGPGRGSGAGSVVAWALVITDLDPLKWGLLFERFLNPERVSMPDFDIDFCQDRRDEVISYVQEKYGHDKVAQIITFGSLQARAALRDVGRVL